MKETWSKVTRNSYGSFWRVNDWMELKHDDFSHPDYTETPPPVETFQHGIPCDWDEDTQAWVLEPTAYASWKSGEWEALMHEHIFQYWGIASQNSLQAHYLLAADEGRADIQAEIKTIWQWIQSCVAYWRSKVAELESAQDPTSVTWDIETACPEPEGGLPRLSDIVAMWIE